MTNQLTKPQILTIPQGTEPQTTICRHCAYMVAQRDETFRETLKMVINHLDKLLKYNHQRGQGLRHELGTCIKALNQLAGEK